MPATEFPFPPPHQAQFAFLPSDSSSLPAFASRFLEGWHDDFEVCSSPRIAPCIAHNDDEYVRDRSSYHLYKTLFSRVLSWLTLTPPYGTVSSLLAFMSRTNHLTCMESTTALARPRFCCLW